MSAAPSPPSSSSWPFSAGQRRLWQIENIAGAKSRCNEVLCLRAMTEGDLSRLCDELRRLLGPVRQFHARVSVNDGEPGWTLDDLARIPEIELGEMLLARAFQSERIHSFDLRRQPPVRIVILRGKDGTPDHVLVTFHPLVMTRARLDSLFETVRTKLTDPLGLYPPSPRCEALRRAAGAADPSAPSRPGEFLGLSALTPQSFPLDRPRDAIRRFATARHELHLPAERSALPDEPSERISLLALFALTLGQYAQQSSIVVAADSAPGRLDWAQPVDSLMDQQLVEAQLCDTTTFVDLVASLERQLAGSESAGLGSLLVEAPGTESMSFAPFCQFTFGYCDSRTPEGRDAALRCYPDDLREALSHSEIDLRVERTESGELCCSLEYATALFEASTIERFAQRFVALVEAAARNPRQSISVLAATTEAAGAKLAANGGAPVSRGTVDGAFRAQARRTPQAIALIEARQHVSFSALDDAASHLALLLAAAGVEAGDRVGVCLSRSIAYVTCVLAILRNHAVYVPLDASLPLANILEFASSTPLKLVLHADAQLARPRWLDVNEVLGSFTHGAPAPDLPAPSPITDAIPAYVLHTSGSTGRPKGVIGSHTSILNRAQWARHALALSDDDVFCLKTRPGSVDHIAEMFQPLLTGGSLVIPADSRDVPAFVADLESHHVSQLTLVPLQLEMLLAVPRFAGLRTLRSVVCSGDTLPWDLARRFFEKLPHARLFNVYGLTETGADSSCYEIPYDGRADFGPYFVETAAPAGLRAITRPGVSLDELRKQFNDSRMPLKLASLEDYRHWLEDAVLPCTVDVSSGRFVGHMTSALPDFMPPLSALVARLNQNMVKIETSKALTLLERQLLAMLHREVFNCVDYEARTQDPQDVFGLVVSGGSTANLTALWNARNGALLRLGFSKDEISRHGAFELLQRAGYAGFAIIASRLAHYSIRKTASLLGVGEDSLLRVKLTQDQTVDLDDLQRTIQLAKDQRRLIIALVGIAGATETGTIDPLAAMAQIARAHGIHFHVDAAWGGAIVFSDRHRPLLEGIQQADTITLCPHKQLYVPQGMSLCLFRDTRAIHASSVQAAYQGRRGSFDTGQYTIEGSRPASFLFLHAIFHLISRRGIGALVDRGIEMTRFLADTLARHEAFELVGAPTINILNYRYIRRSLRRKQALSAEDQRQISLDVAAIQQQQFLQGETFVSRTDIVNTTICDEPITVFRVVIANPLTTHPHLLEMLADQLEIAASVVEGTGATSAAAEARQLRRRAAKPPARVERYAVPIGKPIANTELLALGKDGQVLPVGVMGEIHVGGSGLSLGYLSARGTADAFVPHPFRPGERLFRTGDFGRRLADGNIELAGRRDQQVKIRGMRVELTDIEASLRRLESVRQCVVLAEPGHGDTILVAFVVPSRPHEWPSAEACARTLRHQLLPLLPPYMVPDVLHVLDELPLQAGGKIDRQKLRTLHRYDLALRPKRAESATEAKLREIWEQLIGRGPVNPADDFFEVGGDSLAALTLREDIRRELGVDLTLRSLFEHPRLEDIASRIDEMRACDSSPDLRTVASR